MATESVKVEKTIMDQVREVVKKTKQTIGGFVELAIEEKLKKTK